MIRRIFFTVVFLFGVSLVASTKECFRSAANAIKCAEPAAEEVTGGGEGSAEKEMVHLSPLGHFFQL